MKYLETVPEYDSKWQGECFVFDERVSVGPDLQPGSYDMCHACRMPITEQDKESEYYQKGISCHHCCDKHTPDQVKRYAEREEQREERVRDWAAERAARELEGEEDAEEEEPEFSSRRWARMFQDCRWGEGDCDGILCRGNKRREEEEPERGAASGWRGPSSLLHSCSPLCPVACRPSPTGVCCWAVASSAKT